MCEHEIRMWESSPSGRQVLHKYEVFSLQFKCSPRVQTELRRCWKAIISLSKNTFFFPCLTDCENWDLASFIKTAAATAVKSLQSCPTLCDPIDGSPPGSPVPGTLQARTLEWVTRQLSRYLSSLSDWSPSWLPPPTQQLSLQWPCIYNMAWPSGPCWPDQMLTPGPSCGDQSPSLGNWEPKQRGVNLSSWLDYRILGGQLFLPLAWVTERQSYKKPREKLLWKRWPQRKNTVKKWKGERNIRK